MFKTHMKILGYNKCVFPLQDAYKKATLILCICRLVQTANMYFQLLRSMFHFSKEYFLTRREHFFQKAGSLDSTIRGSNYLILVLHL